MTITIHSIDSRRGSAKDFYELVGIPLPVKGLYFSEAGNLTTIHFWLNREGFCAGLNFDALFPVDNATFTINGADKFLGLHKLEDW